LTSIQDIFHHRYKESISPIIPLDKPIEGNLATFEIKDIQDGFTPSLEYSKILAAKDIVNGGLKDVDSFVSMARRLKQENILNADDMIAVDFLAKQSPKLNFDEFNKIIKNDYLSMEMKGLITTLVQKLEMIDYLSNGSMATLY
ncbi:hypothetical protein BKH42_06815, partial [Helicobacter sp. 13S00482-2]|uniref:hypothetical protein n=1 Tax=Helicobacter sp. 13S00482-2 TaxID=1476200 RepID=UPI000BA60ED2